jgi:YaiO family outer membrane protein
MTVRVLLLALVMTVAGAGVGLGQGLEQAALDAVASKRFRDAVALYSQLAEREPANADYLVWIGRLSSWMQQYEAALDAYERALARAPHNVEALVGKGTVLLWQQKFSGAHRALLQAEHLAPASVDVQLAIARYHHFQRQERLAYARVLRALALEPANHEASELRAQIVLPRPIHVRIGYGRDDFSFASAGHTGSLTAAYAGADGEVALQYERWGKFGETVDRVGGNVTRRLRHGFQVRGGAMFARDATVIARREYAAGFSRPWRRGVVLGGDYRHLDFADVHVHVASPGLEYYVADRPVWVQAVWSHSWTQFGSSVAAWAHNDSVLLRYNEQIAQPLVVHLGYAHGNESFTALSIDQVGRFRANTYSGGLDMTVTPACSIALSYVHQQRSSGAHQRTFGVSVSFRE